jgi:CBS domain-containing protein
MESVRMRARDVMTREVTTARPDMPVREIAALLLAHAISAVPVVDESGQPVGMVSEGDLVGRDEQAREARRDWWLTLLAEGIELSPDFLASLRRPEVRAHAIMSAPVVTVEEDTNIRDIARLLTEYRIKRVPVVRDGRIVGIVSRADLLRALTAEENAPARPKAAGTGHDFFAHINHHFRPEHHGAPAPAAAQPPSSSGESLQSEDFRHLVADFHHREAEHQSAARRAAAAEHRERARELIDRHISDENWRALLHQARQAAEHGAREFLLLRFPHELLSDGGRAVNVPEPDWPQTLRGEAAEIYLRWEHDLKPHGFGIAARVLDFPDGMPGDIGLFLIWGE